MHIPLPQLLDHIARWRDYTSPSRHEESSHLSSLVVSNHHAPIVNVLKTRYVTNQIEGIPVET